MCYILTGNYLDDIDKFIHRDWNFVDIIYIKPVPNLGAYLIGLGLGHYLWKREICKKGRNNMITLCCGWIGFAICVWICFHVLYFSKETLLKRIAFNGFSDFLLSCSVAWIIYVCATQQGVNGAGAGGICRLFEDHRNWTPPIAMVKVSAVCKATTQVLLTGLPPAKVTFLIDSQTTGTLQWVPNHVEIPGNERVDQKAKQGAMSSETEVPFTLRKAKCIITTYIDNCTGFGNCTGPIALESQRRP
ncbi:nose resistant to fluoxetine protein 6 [Trichonephila clavipes]|nr:nose resistant to fluoxetine protein 6 [Trichonephila clavipes]